MRSSRGTERSRVWFLLNTAPIGACRSLMEWSRQRARAHGKRIRIAGDGAALRAASGDGESAVRMAGQSSGSGGASTLQVPPSHVPKPFMSPSSPPGPPVIRPTRTSIPRPVSVPNSNSVNALSWRGISIFN